MNDTIQPKDKAASINWFVLAMRAKRAKPEEPDYPSLQEALYFLRQVSNLSLTEIGLRIGVNATTLSNIEAANLYTGVSLETLENIQQFAKECHLPRMVHYLRMLHVKLRKTPRKNKPSRLTLEDEIPMNRRGDENYRVR